MRRARFLRLLRERGSLRGLARWLFLAGLVVAPWLYGGTTAWSIELINGMLGLVLAIWGASFLVDRKWPAVPRWLVAIVCLILLHGWWMVVNAHAIYDSTFRVFVRLGSILPAVPGSADYVVSFAWMLRATVLLGVLLLVADMVQRSVWLVRLWCAVAISGGSIALLGLIQKATGAKMIFWELVAPSPRFTSTFFASFYYHANAGAFLNLVLPVIGGLVVWTVARFGGPFARTIWATTFLIVVIAIMSNTSRMAQAVGFFLLLALGVALIRPAAKMIARAEKQTLVVGVIVVALSVFAIAQAAQLDKPLLRWQRFTKQLPLDERWTANRAAFTAIGDAGVLGFGPGAFGAVFPHYQQAWKDQLHGTWRFLHDDYLQTVLEWGWMGSALFGALFFGGIALGFRSCRRGRDWSTRQRILLPCTLLSLIGVAIHATVDFPLQILSIQMLVATYLGICWGSLAWTGRKVAVGAQKPTTASE